ncbi:MAG: DUF4115 domain-containing protein [Candidatus Omnitrophica bacterium]|nr:DUF4115 domain-containing protein [Candidatus Omnitrophota bacterium]
MIQEVCVKLKEKRKSLGLRTENIVDKTKLHPSVIRDIEAGDFSNICPAYLKGFIKIYAGFLGIDLGNALEELSAPKKTPPEKKLRLKGPVIPSYSKKVIIYVVVGLIVLRIFIGMVGCVGKIFTSKPKPVSSAQKKSVQSSIPTQKSKPQAKALLVSDFDSGEIVVSLTVKRDCFLRANVDGRLLFQGVLRKGVIETWRGTEEIEFKIGDGSAVMVEVNGKPIPPLTSMRRAIKSLKITPKGISVEK